MGLGTGLGFRCCLCVTRPPLGPEPPSLTIAPSQALSSDILDEKG